MSKEMEGGNRERRQRAKEAREAGRAPSEEGVTLGASKQRSEASGADTHEERIEHIRRGKQSSRTDNEPEARPRNKGPRDR